MNLYVYVCQYSMWFYRIIIQVFWTAKVGIRYPFCTPSDSSRNKFKDGSQLEVVDFSINVALKWNVYWPRWVPYLACIKQSLSDRLTVILPLVRLRSPVFYCVARWTNGGLCCFVVCGVSRLLLIHFVTAGSMYRTYDGFVSLIHTWFFSLLLYTHWPHHRLNGQSKCFERCWDTKSRYHKHQNTVVIFTSQCMKRTSGTGCESWSDFRKRSHRKKETDGSWQLFFMSYYYDYD